MLGWWPPKPDGAGFGLDNAQKADRPGCTGIMKLRT
jgi:hypothetical protein